MATDNNNTQGREPIADSTIHRGFNNNDLPDSPQDAEKLRGEEVTIELPDVKDIPGQEFVQAPALGELGDTTIASADEEADYLFAANDDDAVISNTNTLGRVETADLKQEENDVPSRDEDSLQRASMDNVDFDGTPLNEEGFGSERTGSDLDA